MSICILCQISISIHQLIQYIVINLYLKFQLYHKALQLITLNELSIKLMFSFLFLFYNNKLLNKIFHICLLCEGSKPELGSSKNTTFGFPTKDIANDSLRCIPPESWLLGVFFHYYKSTSFKSNSIYDYKC